MFNAAGCEGRGWALSGRVTAVLGAVTEHPGEAAELENQSFLPPSSSHCSSALGQRTPDTEKWPLLSGRCVYRLILGGYGS